MSSRPAAAPSTFASDEVRVLVTGLDPTAASVALALADAGVCVLNVNDRTRVSMHDIRCGPYPEGVEGLTREYVLRGLLRRRSPRCVPLSASELFPTAVLPSAVVLRAWSVRGDLVRELSHAPTVEPDDALPTLSIVTDGANVLRWPLTDWAHRPCPDCLLDGVRRARRIMREHPLAREAPLLPEHSPALCSLTRTIATGEIAGAVLHQGLGLRDGVATSAAIGASTPWSGTEPVGGPVLYHGLTRTQLPSDPGCLCALAFEGP
ncbi:hypothetical protein [Kocuria marina]|uniref:hypothetical protein n=1 Tax=Kocuria marina TaxID=223184 RepID=UPI003F2992FB